jgi:4'-phosphopantetheinyl transferase
MTAIAESDLSPPELWLIELDRSEAALESLEKATPRLSDDIRNRLAAISNDEARRERRLTHIALRILLERKLGPEIRNTPFVVGVSGKPSLAGSHTSFSLAHTKQLALIGVGNGGLLGVDIEQKRSIWMPEARRVPIEAEAVSLAAGVPLDGTDPDERFLRAWVRIEAVAKARGTGVGPMLERLRPGKDDRREATALDHAPTKPLRVVAHDVPTNEGVFAAVALAVGTPPPSLRTLPETAAAIETLL